MERELMLTGVGGQGVQLAAQTLARGATFEGRFVQYLGTYGGTMRGGNTDAAVVIGDEPLSSPPIVARSWSVIALHDRFFEPLCAKLRDGGVVLVNSSLFEAELETSTHRIFEVPATAIASELGSSMGASMVAVAAYARLTGIVGLDALIEAMSSSLPPYRRQHLEVNCALLRAGYEAFEGVAASAWECGEGAA